MVATRFMVGLLLLKHINCLSDEDVCERWVDSPYFQWSNSEDYFTCAFPHNRCSLSYWLRLLGDKLNVLLAETLRVAHSSGALRPEMWRRSRWTHGAAQKRHVPTYARLVHSAIKDLNRLAGRHGLRLALRWFRALLC